VAKFSFQVQGVAELNAKLRALGENIPEEAGAELYRQAEDVMGDSKQNYVPVDTGTLKSSGYVELPERDGDQLRVEMGYGGAAAPYAIYVHERLDVRHPVGQAKFLELPLLAAVETIFTAIADAVRRGIRK
jgi:hypothetical protein